MNIFATSHVHCQSQDDPWMHQWSTFVPLSEMCVEEHESALYSIHATLHRLLLWEIAWNHQEGATAKIQLVCALTTWCTNVGDLRLASHMASKPSSPALTKSWPSGVNETFHRFPIVRNHKEASVPKSSWYVHSLHDVPTSVITMMWHSVTVAVQYQPQKFLVLFHRHTPTDAFPWATMLDHFGPLSHRQLTRDTAKCWLPWYA